MLEKQQTIIEKAITNPLNIKEQLNENNINTYELK